MMARLLRHLVGRDGQDVLPAGGARRPSPSISGLSGIERILRRPPVAEGAEPDRIARHVVTDAAAHSP